MSRVRPRGWLALSLLFVVLLGCEQAEPPAPLPQDSEQSTDADDAVVLGSSSSALSKADFCYLPSYGRGAGSIPTVCPEGREYDAGLCYPACESGYDGVGPVCWQDCP